MGYMERVVLGAMMLHLVLCPYTKVEESFNLQAMHDLLFHGSHLEKYDHHEFPGVVPRTFIGPLLVSSLSGPLVYLSRLIGVNKAVSQYIVRGMLGVLVLLGLSKWRQAVTLRLGHNVAKWMMIITASQFHFVFYMSRPLPNTFALAIALYSMGCWLRRQHVRFLWSAAFAIIVFRCELVLLLGLLVLIELASRRLSILKLILVGSTAAAFWIGATVLVDSFFWRRWLWPEGEVFWFNTILNKSVQWGTSPYPWYFYSALPRALLASIVMVPVGMMADGRARAIALPALLFIFLYSVLPHKELRFIIYTFPMLNTAAAAACHRFWQGRYKSILRSVLAVLAVGHLVINVAATCFFVYMSRLNYPGGQALHTLHSLEQQHPPVTVHIDVLSAQTGVSRFAHIHDNWIYDKAEGLPPGGKVMNKYTHLLIGVTGKHAKETAHYARSHTTMAVIEGFSHIEFRGRKFPPIRIVTEPKVFVLRRIRTGD